MKKVLNIVFVLMLAVGLTSCKEKKNPIDDQPKYTGTFNRPYASYYEPGVPLVDDSHVVYINWDGFARYYYDDLVKNAIDNNAPTLKTILSEGVFFDDLRNALPSITNPCQNMILSGATSAVTKNVYRYYDKGMNSVVQQQRENASPTLASVAVENGLTTASVAHYLAESVLSPNDVAKIYINADPTNPKVVERGKLKSSDHFSRFEQLIKLVKGESLNTGGGKVTVSQLPKLILFYADDLDAIGHNQASHYGYKMAVSEEERIQSIQKLLKEMDAKLGEFIMACKKANVYDKLTFFLTTDHGMTPFGLSSVQDMSDSGVSKFGELKTFLKKYDSSYNAEMVKEDLSPSSSTSVVCVGANLNLQLTFKKGITDEDLNKLKTQLLKEPYVANVFTRGELLEQGYWVNDTDMIITPKDRYLFSQQLMATYLVRGQHDSSLDSASHIVGLIWGKGIKKNVVYKQRAFNYDFGVTMAATLGIQLPNANGIVLDIFQRD